jgi:hypothetical protein
MRGSEVEEFAQISQEKPTGASPTPIWTPILGANHRAWYPIVMATTILATQSEDMGDT